MGYCATKSTKPLHGKRRPLIRNIDRRQHLLQAILQNTLFCVLTMRIFLLKQSKLQPQVQEMYVLTNMQQDIIFQECDPRRFILFIFTLSILQITRFSMFLQCPDQINWINSSASPQDKHGALLQSHCIFNQIMLYCCLYSILKNITDECSLESGGIVY